LHVCPVVHAVCEHPQLESAFVCSHPLAELPSQSNVFGPHRLHAHAPVPPEQVLVVPQDTVVHVTPHDESALRVFSQPFAALPSQSRVLAAQATQTPPEHFCPVVHVACAQPQFASVSVCSQPFDVRPSQSDVRAAQAEQTPVAVLHVVFVAQTVPAQPQFESVLIFSQPFEPSPSQFRKPATHVGLHAEAEHVFADVCAFVVQILPHAPQFDAFVARFISQPFEPMPSQLPYPPAHVGLHTEAEQVFAVVCAFVVQTVPQAPQFDALFPRLASQPLLALPSQLPKPALQTTEHVPVPAAQLAVPLAPEHAPEQQFPRQSLPDPHSRQPATSQSAVRSQARPAVLMVAHAAVEVQ
jgi:hypothetical protein